jgi:hypothetical protein
MNNTAATAADTLLHAFRGLLPPDTDTPPACGATITRAYGTVPKRGRCPECDRLVRLHRADKGRR